MTDNNKVTYLNPKEELQDKEYAEFKMRLSSALHDIRYLHYKLREYLESNEMVSLLELDQIDYKEKYIRVLKRLKEITGMMITDSIVLITRNLNDETYIRNWFEENKHNKDIINAVVEPTTHID